jgi:hypothetical protein
VERIDSINKKNLVDPLPYEVDELVRKMYHHILQDGCVHCRHILSGKKEKEGESQSEGIISSPENGENRAQNVTSEGSEGSEDIGRTLGTHDPITIYRLGKSDTFACQNCKKQGDRWFMGQHECRGNGKAKSRARAKNAG